MADEFAQYIVKTSSNDLGKDEFSQYIVSPSAPTSQPLQEGFVSNVGRDWSKRWTNISNQPLSRPEGVYRDAGQIAGGIQDVIGEGAKSLYKTVVPDKAQAAASKGAQSVLNTSLGKLGISALQKGQKYYDLFKKTYPNVAADIEATVNIASILPIGKGVEGVVSGAEKLAPKVGDALIGAENTLAKKTIEKETEGLVNLVKRDVSSMTKEERIEALKGNKMEKPGVFKQSTMKTTKQDKEIADSIQGIVDLKKSPVENINSIYKEIGILAEKTKALPAENDKIFNNKEIRGYLAKAKNDTSVILPGDKNLSKVYDSVINDFMNILSKKPNKLSSVLESRKEFDALMKYKNKKVFDRAGAVIDQARKDVRDLANEFVSESLPEGNEFKILLKKQTNLYRAAERIAKNNPEVGKSTIKKAGDFIRQHPYISTGVAGALGYEGGRKINALLP